MKTQLILSVLRSFSGLKHIPAVYFFSNASNKIIDSIVKYKTTLLGLFRINQFLQHGGKKTQLMGLFTDYLYFQLVM